MLAKNSSIEKLSLKENGITSEGALLILTALMHNKRLGHILLDKNDINFNEGKLSEIRNVVCATKTLVWEKAK